MTWLQAPDYWLTRLILERALAAVYLVAFTVTLTQFRPLLGENGLLPVPRFIAQVPFRARPTLFSLRYSDRLLLLVAGAGIVISAAILVGALDLAPLWAGIPAWFVLWALYLSIVNVGQTFYAFGWETLLLEAGFLAIFLGAGPTAAPLPSIYLFRWLLFRVEFGAGLIKMRGDPCWRNLTCLSYHHETQPMPNPLSWFFHHLPRRLHRVEVLGNHFAQLIVPWALFAPQPVSGIAGLIVLVTQGWLVLSGNFSWLNFVTMALAISAFDDQQLRLVLPVQVPKLAPLPLWWQVLVLALTVLVIVLSYRPVRNLLSGHQLMNASFDGLHLVNTYGAFGSITKVRYEIVIEGTEEDPASHRARWKEYEFKGKPGNPRRRPRQFAPYHLRLDWLMWFAAMASARQHPWFVRLLGKLLAGDGPTLKLLARNPFPDRPPRAVRALLYRYRFTTWREWRETRAWWVRDLVGDYVPPTTLTREAGRRQAWVAEEGQAGS
ncbi:MAG: lipase maturation factor family protein [Candidatus Dormibacteraeota bacterium]|nr:lipase maturation factor family protein [Candidatus Dormibacteraeota bacterium]